MAGEGPRRMRRALLVEPPGGYTNNVPSQYLGSLDTRTDEQRLNSRAAYDHWRSELELIRRESPLVKDEEVNVLTILRHSQMPSSHFPAKMSSSSSSTLSPVVISDDTAGSEDDSADPEKVNPVKTTKLGPAGIEPPEFYGINSSQSTEQPLRYQLRKTDVGKIPRPGVPRFNIKLMRQQCGLQRVEAREITDITRTQLLATDTSRPLLFDESVRTKWITDGEGRKLGGLYRGFPMLEDVVFYSPTNMRGTASACFWKAVAYQVYGDQTYDTRVKAEHLAYFSEVLLSPDHPRYELYSLMNKRFYTVSVNTGTGVWAQISVNLYQLMIVPGTYQPMDMFEITADLYNLFTVTYEVRTLKEGDGMDTHDPTRQQTVKVVDMRGSYNARHVFFIFDAGIAHFQPMLPNDFLPSEFRCPRPSWNTTYGYPLANLDPKAKMVSFSTGHNWRNTLGLERGGMRNLKYLSSGPPQVTPLCDEYWIGFVLNGEDNPSWNLGEIQTVDLR